MGKKKLKESLHRKALLLDGYKALVGYWKEEAELARGKEEYWGVIGTMAIRGLEVELEDATRWSAAWKAAAKDNRQQIIELSNIVQAKNWQIGRLEHAKDVWAGRFFAIANAPIPEVVEDD